MILNQSNASKIDIVLLLFISNFPKNVIANKDKFNIE